MQNASKGKSLQKKSCRRSLCFSDDDDDKGDAEKKTPAEQPKRNQRLNSKR